MASSNYQSVANDMILLLGQTGGGKSSIGNHILGATGSNLPFSESSHLKSETATLDIKEGKFFGSETPVAVVDTPGFLDSENRSRDFMLDIIAALNAFPKDKLKVVVVTLPLSDQRANSSYQTTLDEIELLLGGDNLIKQTFFVTTLGNQVADKELAAQRAKEWQQWLANYLEVNENQLHMCNFEYNNPRSLEPLHNAFKQFSSFTPETSEKVQQYMEGNPHASVSEVIENVDTLKKIRTGYEEQIEKLLKQKEEFIARIKEQEQVSSRMQKRLDEESEKVKKLQEELKNRPTQIIREYHPSCCFPAVALANKLENGVPTPTMLQNIKEGDFLQSVDCDGNICFSEVYFAYGKKVEATFNTIYFNDSNNQRRRIKLTADHVIFVSSSPEASDITSMVSELVQAKNHYIWISQNNKLVPYQVSAITKEKDFGLYTILVKDHKLLVDNVLVSAYEISHEWGIADTIAMRALYYISPSFVASDFNKKFCELYDLAVEGCIKFLRFYYRKWF